MGKGHSISWYRGICDASFYHFVKLMGGKVQQGGDLNEYIHKPLCDFWQDDSVKRKAIFMPRGWFKSTVFTQWGAIWRYLQDPDLRVLIISQNEELAKRFQFFIQKMVLDHPFLRKVYRDRLSYVADLGNGLREKRLLDLSWKRTHRWSSTYCDLPRLTEYRETTVTSIGVGGAAQSGHYPLILIDDPVGKKHIDSPLEMEKVFTYFDNVKELLVNPNYQVDEGSVVSIQCTFWGPGDFGTYVMENYPEYQFRVVPALKYPDVVDEENLRYVQHPESVAMESNWPGSPGDRYSTQHYHQMMANPEQEMVFWSQHMNMPREVSGLNKFDYKWIRWFHFEEDSAGSVWAVCDDDGESYRLADQQIIGIIDPGGFAETKLAKSGARCAMLQGFQPRDSLRKFVVYTWAGKPKEPSKFRQELYDAQVRYHARRWKIETIQAQDYIYRDILEEKKALCPELRISPLERSPRKDDKKHDIVALIQPISNGEIYLHKSMYELISEIKNYPHGITNDILDCLAKLNKYYWSRTPKGNWDKKNKERREATARARGRDLSPSTYPLQEFHQL